MNPLLPLPEDFAAALQFPIAALRMTGPQAVPANAWTTLMWGEILLDPQGGCDPRPPHTYICPAPGVYRAATTLWLPDAHPAMLSLGLRVGDEEPMVAFRRILEGQDPDARKAGEPPPIVEQPYIALFNGAAGDRIQLAVRHDAGCRLLFDEGAEMVSCLTIQYVADNPVWM